MQFAMTYVAEAFDTRTKLMGRQSAGVGFLRAALAARPERIWCYAPNRALAETFGQDVRALTSEPPELRYIGWDQSHRLASAGTLYRPDPGIGEDAWHRRQVGNARAYSLCGVTHTLSSTAAMSTVSSYLRSPLFSWDAVICTSTVVRDVVRYIVEREAEHLRTRMDARQFPLPQFPLIPLGTHVDDFKFDGAARAASRASMQIDEDDVAALFVGRISFHGKAHPLPMYLGLERAARKTGRRVHLVLCGNYAVDGILKVFETEAQRFAPSVRLIVLNGEKKEDRDKAWACADLFTSLSDNIQETFGLTPIEAMAAGLPSVVSDWNGYKDTIRDGVDGFRVPVTTLAAGYGQDLAHRLDMGIDTYDRYIGMAAQFVSIDIEAATEAYTRLISSSELRRTMGDAAQRRAREVYDWSVIFRRYVTLWDELAERRRSDPHQADELSHTHRPDRPDPFALFQTFPTHVISDQTIVSTTSVISESHVVERRSLGSVSFAQPLLPSSEHTADILAAMTELQECAVAKLRQRLPNMEIRAIHRSLAWLSKMGLVYLKQG